MAPNTGEHVTATSASADGLNRIEVYVCDLCLGGAGGECHWPGCGFWMHDAPTGVAREWLREQVEYTAARQLLP